MPTYQAVNPSHTRVINTDDLWWLEHAWSERTLEWFCADETRFSQLLEGIFTASHANIPELLPSADWLVEASRRAIGRVSHPDPRFKGAFQDAFYLENHVIKVGGWNPQLKKVAKGAAQLIATLTPLTDENFPAVTVLEEGEDGRVSYVKWLTSRSIIAQGVASNPTLPALTTPIDPHSDLTPYHWLVKSAINDFSSQKRIDPILQLLVRNPGASTEDIEFILSCLDVEAERMRSESKTPQRANGEPQGLSFTAMLDYSAQYGSIRRHPNFVSWPTVDRLFGDQQNEAAQYDNSKQAAVATFERLALDAEYSPARRTTALDNPEKYASWAVNQIVCESLLFDKKQGLTRRILNRLRTAEATGGIRAIRYIGYYAPVLGAVLASLDDKYGSRDVPLEWVMSL